MKFKARHKLLAHIVFVSTCEISQRIENQTLKPKGQSPTPDHRVFASFCFVCSYQTSILPHSFS